MNYLDFLGSIHQKLNPSLYLEIGCANGSSLSRAKCRSIGVDPDYNITAAIHASATLYRETSDHFFARSNIKEILGRPIDMAFIDGMHLADYALKDFINIEALSHRNSIIILDDVCPERIEIASRDRKEIAWTGDVYKVISILRKYRPDLSIEVADIPVKGMSVVRNLDPSNRVLSDNLDLISADILGGLYDIVSHDVLLKTVNPKRSHSVLDGLKW